MASRTAFSLLGALGEAEDIDEVDTDALAPEPEAEEDAPRMPQRPKRPAAPPKPRPPPDVSDRLTLEDRKFTRMCDSFLTTGRCDRDRCYFAHDYETQRTAKQRLARRVAEERARLGWVPPHQTDPEHPHHYHAVRGDGQDGASSSSAAYEVPGAFGSGLDPSRVPEWAGGERNPFFKTRICLNYLRHNGNCHHGDYCQFAHGERELREHLLDEAAVQRELAAKGLRPQLGPITPVPAQLHASPPFGFAPAPPPPGYRPTQLQYPPGYGPPPPPPGHGQAQHGYGVPGASMPRPPPAAALPVKAADVGAVPMSSQQLADYLATAAQLEDEDVPEWACCPITQVQFDDPVVAADGHTYERHAIEAWLATNGTSPMTGAALTDTRLLPNYTLAAALRAAVGEHACTGRDEHDVHWAAQLAMQQYERAAEQVAAQQSRHAAAAAEEQPVLPAAAARQSAPRPHHQRPAPALQPQLAGAAADAAAAVRAIAAAEPALVEAPPRYSTHTCIGGKPDDNWHGTTCKFDNVCLDAATGQFEYYLDPAIVGDLPVAHHQVNGAPLDQFPPHLLNLGHAHISQDESMAWRPVVKRQAFPREGPHMRWAPVQQALVTALAPMLTDNFGHVMYDLLVPLFSMQQLFRVYTPDAQILITAAVKGSREELESGLRKFINTQLPAKSLARLTWNHDAAWVHDYAREVLGGQDQGLVCFKTVLAGTGMLSRQLARVDSLPYRQAVVQHIGLQEVPQRQPVITILRKAEGRRRVENSGEVAALLRRRYPAAKVQTVSFDRRPDMTVTEQVKLMSDTSILVTPCGGLATVLTFLRPGAAAIAMNFWHSVQQRSLQLEDNYYSRLEYIDIQYMPVTPEDYAATSDRPGCELVEGGPRPQDAHYPLLGALVHCNLRLAPAGLTRLARYVDAAMLRWAAAHGRYDVLPPPTEPLVVTDGGGSADGSSGSGSASSGSSSSGGHASSGQEAEGQAADALPLAGGEQHADMAPLQQREAEQPSGPGSRQRHRKEGGHAIYER